MLFLLIVNIAFFSLGFIMNAMKNLQNAALCLLIFFAACAGSKAQPVLNAVTSTYSTVGSLVTISGSGFDPAPSRNLVKFGSVSAEVVYASPTLLKVIVPQTGNDAYISVINRTTGLRGTSKHQFSNRYCVNSYPGFNYSAAFSTQQPNNGLSNPNAIDVDGDGRTDLVAGHTQFNNIYVQLGQAGTLPALSNSFAISAHGTVNGTNTLVTGDMDNDGLEDVVLSPVNSGNEVEIYINHSTPGNVVISWQTAVAIPGPPGPIALADYDNDGRLDIAVASSNGSVYVMRNLGGFAFAAPVTLVHGGTMTDLFAADIDDNRLSDLLPASSSGLTFLNTSVPGTISFSNYTLSNLANALQFDAVDLDRNGVVDLLSRIGGGVYAHRNIGGPGAPMFAPAVNVHSGHSMGAADLTGDGKADAFYTMYNGWICANENQSTPGTCTWGGQRDYTCSGQGPRFFRGDFNGDGLEDFGGMGTDGRINIVSAAASGIYGLDLSVVPACNGHLGSATVSELHSSAGSAGATYNWSNGASGPSVSSLNPGTYMVTVSQGSCNFAADFEVNTGNAVTAQVNVTQPMCPDDNGQVVITPSGGTDYTYAWSNGSSASQAMLPVGNYSVTVTAETGCQAVQSVVLAPIETVDAQLSVTQPTCVGLPGVASVTSVSGGANHTFLWSNGDQTTTVNLPAGLYAVTVTSAHGCQDVEYANIIAGTGQPLDGGADQTVCGGEDVILTGTGDATSYVWSNGVMDGVAFQPIQTDFYVLSGVDAACPFTDTVWVTVNLAPDAQFTAAPNQLTVQFTDLTPGFVSHLWNFGDNSTSTQANPLHTYASPGTYEVCLTATGGNACPRTVCEMVTVIVTGAASPAGLNFSVAPNPVRDILQVSLDHHSGGTLHLRVMDATGKVLVSAPFIGNAAEVNVSSLAPGLYILDLAEGDLSVRNRFVKQ